jgi:virulence-associated protein VagC
VTETFKARIEIANGHQVIVLPPEIHLDGNEVTVQQDGDSGSVTLSPASKRPSLREFLNYRDTHPIPEEEWERFHAAIKEGRCSDLPDDPNRVLRILQEDE